MAQLKLHTTDLPIVLNREFRNFLIENFTNIERFANGGATESGDDYLKKQLAQMNARITNIAAGKIDPMALDQAVDQAVDAALKRKGVI